GRPTELRLGVGGEELPRRRRCPLLPHEEHRGERGGQCEQRGERELIVVELGGEAVADRPVPDLVVVLTAHDEAPGGGSVEVDRRPVVTRAERRVRAVVEEAAREDLGERCEWL